MYAKFIAAMAARPLTTSEFGEKTRPSCVKILFKNAVSPTMCAWVNLLFFSSIIFLNPVVSRLEELFLLAVVEVVLLQLLKSKKLIKRLEINNEIFFMVFLILVPTLIGFRLSRFCLTLKKLHTKYVLY